MSVLLIVPCYRERARLPGFLPELCRALAGASSPVRILVVDDGSGPEEQAWLRDWMPALCETWPQLLPPLLLAENQGKGGAVYAGWSSSHAADATFLGFVDADGAISPGEVLRLVSLLAENGASALFAVRTGTDGTKVIREPGRALSGRVFRFLVRLMFGFPVPDTQCGCKFIPAAAWSKLLPSLTERRFTFDVDLTQGLLCAGISIRPIPIDWSESPGTRLRASSALHMFLSLLRLRFR